MKKLLTLIAFLSCFLGAKAEWVENYRVDYSSYSGFPFYVMGYVPEWKDGIMTDLGAMYKYATELVEDEVSDSIVMTDLGKEYYRIPLADPQWHQYMIADNIPTEIGSNYRVRAKVRASEPCYVNVNMLWSWGEDPISASAYIDTEWQEVVWEYNEIGGTSCTLVAQPGTLTATIEWQYVIVKQEKKQDTHPVEWVEMLTNGDAEEPWSDPDLAYNADNNKSICAWAKQKGTNVDDDGIWHPFPANIEKEADGNHVFVVHGALADSEDGASSWDNQFWIQSPQVLKVGTQVKLHFRYKASQPAKTVTQTSGQYPGDYIIYHAIGDINFTEEWQEFDGIMTIESDMKGSSAIAFNLNDEVKEPTDFYFDDLSWQIMKLDEGFFAASSNSNTGIEYDYENAIEFVQAPDGEELLTATVGTEGDEKTWVNDFNCSR